jgi:hypothetical protein
MDELIQEMDSLFKQVVKYYPMNDIKETKKQWNDLVEAVAKQSKQQGNCNLPHVINSDQLHICKYCGAETTQPDEQCYKAEDKASVCEDSLYEKTMKKGINL